MTEQTTPLEEVARTTDPRVVESFSLLSDKIRLSILLALWEHQYPHGNTRGATFSELRRRVGVRDSGKFNYHLDQLSDDFIERTEDGYVLTKAGARFVRTIVAWTDSADVTFDSQPVDETCPFCGDKLHVSYEDETLAAACSSCRGGGSFNNNTLVNGVFPPSGVESRTPEQSLHAATRYMLHITYVMLDGICPVCAAEVELQLIVCEDHHSADGICGTCGSRFPGLIEMSCSACRAPNMSPTWLYVLNHPSVIAFHYERELGYDHTSWEGVFQRALDCDETVKSTDPPSIELTFKADGDELMLTIDKDLTVVVED